MDPIETPRPPFWRALLLRFGVLYWALFAIPVIFEQITASSKLGGPVMDAWHAMVRWVGDAGFGVALDFTETGSGDRTGDWISLLCIAVLALVGSIAWAAIDRRRRQDARLREILRIFLRYTLAFIMLEYGLSKLFFGQFPPPGDYRLNEKYGDSSPMGLLWTFMGYSPAYVFFSGAAETLGAALLFFRRTTTLGALILFAVLTNVVLLNFCYDVPVKINSTHYLIICVVLLAPELRRLAAFFLGRPTPASFPRWSRALKYVVIAVFVYFPLRDSLDHPSLRQTWYSGYWMVSTFSRDGHDVSDATRWQRLKFEVDDDGPIARWRNADESYGDLYDVTFDDAKHTMRFAPSTRDTPTHATGPIDFTYTRTGDDLELRGTVAGHALDVHLTHLVTTNTPLMSRGFHWINEFPFNR